MSDEKILSVNSCTVKKSDIETLSPSTYLNDLIIMFYYEMIEGKYPSKDITLLEPSVSMSITSVANDGDDLEDLKECIFLPLELDKKNLFLHL
jgi:hypothetical protein